MRVLARWIAEAETSTTVMSNPSAVSRSARREAPPEVNDPPPRRRELSHEFDGERRLVLVPTDLGLPLRAVHGFPMSRAIAGEHESDSSQPALFLTDSIRAPVPGVIRDEERTSGPPRATLPLTSAGLSTRERESSRGLPLDGENNSHGCSRTPRFGVRNREREPPDRPAANSCRDAGLGDLAQGMAESPSRKPKRRRKFAAASKAPRPGLEPGT
jgi:hypothetical protein